MIVLLLVLLAAQQNEGLSMGVGGKPLTTTKSGKREMQKVRNII